MKREYVEVYRGPQPDLRGTSNLLSRLEADHGSQAIRLRTEEDELVVEINQRQAEEDQDPKNATNFEDLRDAGLIEDEEPQDQPRTDEDFQAPTTRMNRTERRRTKKDQE